MFVFQSLEKPEDFSNSEKKTGPSELDVLQQVIVELRTEVSVLKEQLEKEKKAASDLKSLKTQQVSTLTSKLANAVRQREQAEEELVKVKKEMEELKEGLKAQAEEIQVKETEESHDEIDGCSKLENSTEICLVEETSEVNKNDNSAKVIDNDIVSSCLEKDESNQEEGSLVNRKGSLQLENKSDVLSSEDSFQSCFPEYSPKEELCQSVSLIEVSEVSLSSCSELGDDFSKENSSIQEKLEGLFDQEDLLISSPEIYDTSLISLSLESLEENPKEITEALQGSKKVQEDLCNVQESPLTVPKAGDVKDVPERRQQISEKPNSSSTLKNKRIRSQTSEEDQESSPPTSPEAVSSGYTSNSTEEKLENLLMNHGMANDHNAPMFSGNDVKEQEVYPKVFLNEDREEDITEGTKREQDKKGLEDFMQREQAAETILNENYKTSSLKNTESKAEKGVKKSIERQNDYFPQTMSEEVFNLKQQLKNALKEIDELRLENKQMKKEIQNLSSTSAEEEFLLKTTRFTDRILREMREREARVYVPRSLSTLEKYGLEREHSYPGLTELSQMRVTRDMNRSEAKKTSLPLKIIGAKLKELTRSVENMATDPGLCEESLPDLCAPDGVRCKQRFPSLNDHFELEESLLMPTVSSDTLSAQNTPFKHEKPGDVPRSGSFTSVENLGKERFLATTKSQLQFIAEKDLTREQPGQSENKAHKDCPWRDNRCQLAERQAQERSGFESLCDKWKLHSDNRDYVER